MALTFHYQYFNNNFLTIIFIYLSYFINYALIFVSFQLYVFSWNGGSINYFKTMIYFLFSHLSYLFPMDLKYTSFHLSSPYLWTFRLHVAIVALLFLNVGGGASGVVGFWPPRPRLGPQAIITTPFTKLPPFDSPNQV